MGASQSTTQNPPHQPSVADVIAVKRILSSPSLSNPLPLEIIDIIIDNASYWPHTSITIDRTARVRGGGQGLENQLYLRTLPLGLYGPEGDITATDDFHTRDDWDLGGETDETIQNGQWLSPRGEHPARMIVFDIWSHDQGWSGETPSGPYSPSYTWFDAQVESVRAKAADDTISPEIPSTVTWSRLFFDEEDTDPDLPVTFVPKNPTHPFLPPPSHLQRNVLASRVTRHHTITIHYQDSVEEGSPEALEAEEAGRGWKSMDGSFVHDLRVGDCVTLWGRARFPGWENTVEKAKVNIYWAV